MIDATEYIDNDRYTVWSYYGELIVVDWSTVFEEGVATEREKEKRRKVESAISMCMDTNVCYGSINKVIRMIIDEEEFSSDVMFYDREGDFISIFFASQSY